MKGFDKMKKMSTKKMVTIAMLTAASYILAITIRFPLLPQAPFIKYSPSDIPTVIGGMIFGPFGAFMMTLAVSILEEITIGTTGIIGAVMNIASTASFAVVIAAIYKRKKTNKNAILAFCIGSIVMIITMVIMNVLLTPLYTGASTEKVIGMLLPVIIPVNLIKAIINSVVSFAIYKGISKFIKVKEFEK